MILEQDKEQETLVVGRGPDVLRLTEIFEAAEKLAENEPEKIITYNYEMESFHAYRGEVTLVMCREIRKTVEIASTIALKLSMKFPEENILVFNTYAGADLLTSGFVNALHLLKMKVPWTFHKYLPDVHIDQFDDSVDLPSPPNLQILDCPTAMLTPKMLESEIHRNKASIVLINSLEFASFSDYRKKELAEAILDLRKRKNLSFIVFSHELRALVPYSSGRGALGILSAFSKSVWHIVGKWEQRKWVRMLKEIEL